MQHLVASVIRDYAAKDPRRRAHVLRAGGAGVEVEPPEYTGKCKRGRKPTRGKCPKGMHPYERPTNDDNAFETCCMKLALDGLDTMQRVNRLNMKKDELVQKWIAYHKIQTAGNYDMVHSVIKGDRVKRYRFTPKSLALKIASVRAKVERVEAMRKKATPFELDANRTRDLHEDIAEARQRSTTKKSTSLGAYIRSGAGMIMGSLRNVVSNMTNHLGYAAVTAVVVGCVVLFCGGVAPWSWPAAVTAYLQQQDDSLFTTIGKVAVAAGAGYLATQAIGYIKQRAQIPPHAYTLAMRLASERLTAGDTINLDTNDGHGYIPGTEILSDDVSALSASKRTPQNVVEHSMPDGSSIILLNEDTQPTHKLRRIDKGPDDGTSAHVYAATDVIDRGTFSMTSPIYTDPARNLILESKKVTPIVVERAPDTWHAWGKRHNACNWVTGAALGWFIYLTVESAHDVNAPEEDDALSAAMKLVHEGTENPLRDQDDWRDPPFRGGSDLVYIGH